MLTIGAQQLSALGTLSRAVHDLNAFQQAGEAGADRYARAEAGLQGLIGETRARLPEGLQGLLAGSFPAVDRLPRTEPLPAPPTAPTSTLRSPASLTLVPDPELDEEFQDQILPPDHPDATEGRFWEKTVLERLLDPSSPFRIVSLGSHVLNGKSANEIWTLVFGQTRIPDHVLVLGSRELVEPEGRGLVLSALGEGRKVLVVDVEGTSGTRAIERIRERLRDEALEGLVPPPQRAEIVLPVQEMNRRQATAFLENSGGSGAGLVAPFVLDRLPAFPALLKAFVDRGSPEEVLTGFAAAFSDEAALNRHLARLGLRSKIPIEDGEPIGYDLKVLSSRVVSDAALFLVDQDLSDKALFDEELAPEGRGLLTAALKRLDPNRIIPKPSYDLADLESKRALYGDDLSDGVLRTAYAHMLAMRVMTQRIYQRYTTEQFAFAITDSGHEIAGSAAALALFHATGGHNAAVSPHYRSGTLVGLWEALQGNDHFYLDYMRQQFSRDTDPWSRGRQTSSHFSDPDRGVLPAQSALGMNLGKAAGYALALKQEGHKDAVVLAEIGDGTLAESDLHEAMTAASIQDLPLVVSVVDNNAGISVEPSEGRGIRDMQAFAQGFGAGFFTADGNDFLATYHAYRQAADYAKRHQKPVIVWIQNLSRFNAHSSASQYTFDARQPDSLLDLGKSLASKGILQADDVLRRKPFPEGRDYFLIHDLGKMGQRALERVVAAWDQARGEAEPTLEIALGDSRPPFPDLWIPGQPEPDFEGPTTAIDFGWAIRAALRDILKEDPLAWMYGQDIGRRGGALASTIGLWERLASQVQDAPINEPLIMGLSVGKALRRGHLAIAEIQFGDYYRNAHHWFVHMANLFYSSGGRIKARVIARVPVEPLLPHGGGAIYHSAALEGELCGVPGITIVCPSTSWDAYGLLRTAAEYEGPTVVFEPKGLYRLRVGPAFPGEPTDAAGIDRLRHPLGMDRRGIPDIPGDIRVPFGQASVRHEGHDVTIVSWGSAMVACEKAMEALRAQGLSCELIDLRTLVPFDRDTVFASVRKTGRLLVVSQAPTFGGLGRTIEGEVVERFQGDPIVTHVMGMRPVTGIPQHKGLEHQIVITPDKVVAAAQAVWKAKTAGGIGPAIWIGESSRFQRG